MQNSFVNMWRLCVFFEFNLGMLALSGQGLGKPEPMPLDRCPPSEEATRIKPKVEPWFGWLVSKMSLVFATLAHWFGLKAMLPLSSGQKM